MQRNLPDHVPSWLPESGDRGLLVDNWRFQRGGLSSLAMTHCPRPEPETLAHPGDEDLVSMVTAQGFNINEDDLDCPGHGRTPRSLYGTTAIDALLNNEDDLYYIGLSGHNDHVPWGQQPTECPPSRFITDDRQSSLPAYRGFSLDSVRNNNVVDDDERRDLREVDHFPRDNDDSGKEDSFDVRTIRAMSIDSVGPADADDHADIRNHNHHIHTITPFVGGRFGHEEEEEDYESESEKSPRPESDSLSSSPPSLSLDSETTPSSYNVAGDAIAEEKDDSAAGADDDEESGGSLDATGTDPGTAVGTPMGTPRFNRRLSKVDPLLDDPEEVFKRLESRE